MKNGDIKLAKGVTIEKSIFDSHLRDPKKGLSMGGMVYKKVPKDCDLIILCGNSGGGHRPYKCLLPHQMYLDDLKEDFEKHGFEVITIFPVKSKTNLNIAYNGDYGKQRWGNS